MHILTQIFLTHLLFSYLVSGGPEEQQGVKYANKCEGNYIRTVFIDNFLEIYGENRGDVETFPESYLGYIDCNTLRAGYPESKRLGETLCNAYAQTFGLDFVIPRLSRVYGPTMLPTDSKAISQFIKKAAAGAILPPLFGDFPPEICKDRLTGRKKHDTISICAGMPRILLCQSECEGISACWRN